MKKLLVGLLLCAGIAGCVNPFMSDPAAALREADSKKIAELDARLVQAYQQMEALSKSPATAETTAAAKALADGLKALQAERDATKAHQESLPKPGVNVDGILGLAEPLAGLAGAGWIVSLIRAGRKAKATYDEQLEAHESHFTAAVAGVEDFANTLTPEQKRQLYESLKRAAKAHTEDPLAMAERVAIAKTRLRGSI